MCGQPYARCRNWKCDGYSVIQPIIPCANSPNCEIKQIKIPGKHRPSMYCPDCSGYTKKQRNVQSTQASRARKKAKAIAQQGGTIITGVEQQAESSTMGETTGLLGGGILPGSDDPFSSTEEFEESDPRFFIPGEATSLGSGLFGAFQNEQPTELVSGSNVTAVGAHAYPEHPSMSFFPGVTPAPNDLAQFQSSGSFRANAFNESFGYGNPADIITSVPRQEATNFAHLSFEPMMTQFGVHPPSSPQIPIDPALLAIDAIYPNGIDTVAGVQDAQLLFGIKEAESE